MNSAFTPLPAAGADQRPLPTLLGPGGRTLKALLADDNAVNREVGAALLQQLGLEVHTVDDGVEAVAAVAHGHYDLVLMDMQMPRQDGLSATREIRQLPGAAALPVIAMTANAFDQNRIDCLAAGMNDFVTKPVDLWRLADTLARWIPR